MAVLASGTMLAQIINIFFLPIITRIYGPDIYGVLGVFNSTVMIMTPLVALTFPYAIVLANDKKNSEKVVKLSLQIAIIIITIITIIFLIFNDQIVDVLNINEIREFIFLIPLILLFTAFYQVMNQWLIRNKEFQTISKIEVIHALSLNLSKTIGGLFAPFAFVLVLLTTLGRAIKGLLLYVKSGSSPFGEGLFINKTDFMSTFIKYRDFPFYRSPQTIISELSKNLPIIVLVSIFSPAAAGFFTLSKTAMKTPSNLLGKAVGNVFYQKIAEGANNNNNIIKPLISASLSLLLIGIIPFGLIIFFGPIIFSFIFGTEWYTAGEYARWIGILSFCSFVANPSVKSLAVIKAQRLHLYYTIIKTIVSTALLLLGAFVYENDVISVALYGISSGIFSLILVVITIKLVINFSKDAN
ncbi:lipopolysaccharide biosynthesis protein [Salisediminibacterium halotolerans]|uniref:lipopolysaccharide biosynthesis protein n=1 Tax=Salisediminibacterium halotolerans TaxID=517425 RepID=UPI0013152293|nr:oligosaccharide flippase family protein [Salisediminibacterium halotolerans]